MTGNMQLIRSILVAFICLKIPRIISIKIISLKNIEAMMRIFFIRSVCSSVFIIRFRIMAPERRARF